MGAKPVSLQIKSASVNGVKVALINEAESGKSCEQLADQFNIERTQATSIIKRKAELMLEYDQNNTQLYMQH